VGAVEAPTDLMTKKITGSGQNGTSWYVVFSTNEMVVIVEKGNALRIRHVEDLAKPEVKFVRVTRDKDLATSRTIEFLKSASTLGSMASRSRSHLESTLRPVCSQSHADALLWPVSAPNSCRGLRPRSPSPTTR
jgi:ABC-type molybdate transport system substrate-binding protein